MVFSTLKKKLKFVNFVFFSFFFITNQRLCILKLFLNIIINYSTIDVLGTFADHFINIQTNVKYSNTLKYTN